MCGVVPRQWVDWRRDDDLVEMTMCEKRGSEMGEGDVRRFGKRGTKDMRLEEGGSYVVETGSTRKERLRAARAFSAASKIPPQTAWDGFRMVRLREGATGGEAVAAEEQQERSAIKGNYECCDVATEGATGASWTGSTEYWRQLETTGARGAKTTAPVYFPTDVNGGGNSILGRGMCSCVYIHTLKHLH